MNIIDPIVKALGNPKSTSAYLVGWITPENEFMVVDMYSHFPELKKRGLYPELFYKLEEATDNELQDQADFLNGVGEDEHVPWHCYYSEWENVRDNTRREIIDRAYRDGWVRIGFCRMRSGSNHKLHRVLELEGCPTRLKELKKDAEFLAETYMAEYIEKTR